jgi:hypothetical protein
MNLKRKLLQCNANIKFNKTCLVENIVPKYAAIKVTGNTTASKNTEQKEQRIRIQNEIKYLYKKKQKINELYLSHLYNANQWQNLWTYLEHSINEKLNLEIQIKLRNETKKIYNEKMKNIPIQNTSTQNGHNTQFYTRLVNNTT